jgi:hypothetical protein
MWNWSVCSGAEKKLALRGTALPNHRVIPAKAGIQFFQRAVPAARNWIPAFAGMTSCFVDWRERNLTTGLSR